jgi:hypothetical protein
MAAPTPRSTIAEILHWADWHRRRTGRWPSGRSGPVRGAPGEHWSRIDAALRRGLRGLSGGTSLAGLLAAHRGKELNTNRPPLSEREILALADGHLWRTGEWPTADSGRVLGAPGRSWRAIDKQLTRSARGDRGVATLAQLLAKRRDRRNPSDLPRLTYREILEWAARHHRRSGRWPVHHSGPVTEAPEESWANIDAALRVGGRGLAVGSSLAMLLARYRRVPNRLAKRPRLTFKKILLWADRHRRRTGTWPEKESGPIPRSGGETWIGIGEALLRGRRGLPGGTTLVQLLAKHRGRPYRRKGPDLAVRDILRWAEVHHRRTGRWPSQGSGPVRGAPGERWGNVQSALYTGRRGLPGGSSLAKLLDERFGT